MHGSRDLETKIRPCSSCIFMFFSIFDPPKKIVTNDGLGPGFVGCRTGGSQGRCLRIFTKIRPFCTVLFTVVVYGLLRISTPGPEPFVRDPREKWGNPRPPGIRIFSIFPLTIPFSGLKTHGNFQVLLGDRFARVESSRDQT